MSFIRQIFDYIKTLPSWQQDAARRLYEKRLSCGLIKNVTDTLRCSAVADGYSFISRPESSRSIMTSIPTSPICIAV